MRAWDSDDSGNICRGEATHTPRIDCECDLERGGTRLRQLPSGSREICWVLTASSVR